MENSKYIFATGSATFEITDYSFVKKYITNGQCIRSDPFTVGGQQWTTEFYPNGFNADYADNVSIVVRLLNFQKPVQALYTFHLKDSCCGTDVWSNHTPMAIMDDGLVTFSHGDSAYISWGKLDFMKRSDLEASTYLDEGKDTLIIKTTLWVLEE